METKISKDALKTIKTGILEKYAEVAKNPEGHFKYPTGMKGLEKLRYDKTLIDQLPDAVAASYCGVGNPFSLGNINSGDQVLDLGCGAGVDAIIAAMMAGPEGSVVGLDIVPEMLKTAGSNLRLTQLANVTFKNASGEKLPFLDDTIDVVISNGVINLIPDKERVLKELIRVLKSGGRLMMADQVSSSTVKKNLKARLASWFQ
jgi:SAM-dependent methyltransferase